MTVDIADKVFLSHVWLQPNQTMTTANNRIAETLGSRSSEAVSIIGMGREGSRQDHPSDDSLARLQGVRTSMNST